MMRKIVPLFSVVPALRRPSSAWPSLSTGKPSVVNVGLAVVVDGKALGGPDVAGRRARPPREDVARHLVDLHDGPAASIVARHDPPHSKRHGSSSLPLM